MNINTDTLKKYLLPNLPYLLFVLVFANLGEAVRLAPGADAPAKFLGLSDGFSMAFQSLWPGAAVDWLVGICGAALIRLIVYLKGKDAKKYRKMWNTVLPGGETKQILPHLWTQSRKTILS